MPHLCDNCKFKYIPESIHDYRIKTFHLPPHLCEWGNKDREQLFFLCSNPKVAEVDHTNNTTIYTECYKHNFNGECHYYHEEGAEDIIPSTIEINVEKVIESIEPPADPTDPIDPSEPINPDDPIDPDNEGIDTHDDGAPIEPPEDPDTPEEPIEPPEEEPEEPHYYVGDIIKLSITATPFSKPAVTEDIEEEITVPKLDIDDQPMVDENGEQIYETVTVTKTVEIEPAFTNEQAISYKYQWYKNGRKLWKEKESELIINVKEVITDKYLCEVTQLIEDNGDGGDKEYTSKSEEIELIIEEKPEEPSEPEEPTDPSEPTEPVDPVEPSDPDDSTTDPEDSENP